MTQTLEEFGRATFTQEERKRFDEQLPRTETLFAVASIGYRIALRDLATKK